MITLAYFRYTRHVDRRSSSALDNFSPPGNGVDSEGTETVVVIPDDIPDPTFLFDGECLTRLKFGSRSNVYEYGLMVSMTHFRCGNLKEADALYCVTVPNDQELVDRLMDNTAFFEEYVSSHQHLWVHVSFPSHLRNVEAQVPLMH